MYCLFNCLFGMFNPVAKMFNFVDEMLNGYLESIIDAFVWPFLVNALQEVSD